jgi:hypothetical protein
MAEDHSEGRAGSFRSDMGRLLRQLREAAGQAGGFSEMAQKGVLFVRADENPPKLYGGISEVDHCSLHNADADQKYQERPSAKSAYELNYQYTYKAPMSWKIKQ